MATVCVEYDDIWVEGRVQWSWVVRVGVVQSDVACQVLEERGCVVVLVSGCFRGMGGLERAFLSGLALGSFPPHAWTLFLCLFLFLFYPFLTLQAMGSQGNLSAEVEQATRRQVQGMQSSQQKNRERVLAQLLGMVCDVRPQVHPNYRIAA